MIIVMVISVNVNSEKVKALLNILEPIAKEKGGSLAQLVFRWTTLQQGIIVVLAGARNADQAIANAILLIWRTQNLMQLIWQFRK